MAKRHCLVACKPLVQRPKHPARERRMENDGSGRRRRQRRPPAAASQRRRRRRRLQSQTIYRDKHSDKFDVVE